MGFLLICVLLIVGLNLSWWWLVPVFLVMMACDE